MLFAMKLLKILGGLVVLLLVALLVAGLFIDGIAKSAIETAATEALGVKTELGSCHVGLLRGTFSLSDLRVANPEGYGSDPFLTLGEGGVAVKASTLREDLVELPELTLSTARLLIVQNRDGSNYGTILDNLKRFQGEETQAPSEDQTRFVIRRLAITDVKVTVAPDPGLGLSTLQLPIDRIELKDIGSDTGKGVLLSELAGIVVKAILQRATSSGQLPALIQGVLGGKLKGLGSSIENEVKKRLDDAAKDATNRLKGLIGR